LVTRAALIGLVALAAALVALVVGEASSRAGRVERGLARGEMRRCSLRWGGKARRGKGWPRRKGWPRKGRLRKGRAAERRHPRRGGEASPPRAKPPNPRAKAASVETRHELPSATSVVTARTEMRVMWWSPLKVRCEDSHLPFWSPDRAPAFASRPRVYRRKRADVAGDAL
jgi:hypothetical protein